MAKKSSDNKSRKETAHKPSYADSHWMHRLSRSGYFLGAVLLHLVVLLMIATWVIWPKFVPKDEDFSKSYTQAGGAPPPPPPPPPMTVPPKIIPNQPTIFNSNRADITFTIPLPDVQTKIEQTVKAPVLNSIPSLQQRLPNIAKAVQSWRKDSSHDADPHSIKAEFPVYVAYYADGDWNCNLNTNQDNTESATIEAGSIPNLVEKINEWSKGDIKGKVVTKPLDLGSSELMEKMPPFVFFTGHKDFQLTEQEIENLRNYLQNGGAIWGDNALAGEGSRFDVAFRREMKRVIPDSDKNFEPLPMSHEIFTKSWFTLAKLPEGMNYYAEPLQHIDLDGKIAIIYTPNDYSDLMFLHIPPGDTEADFSVPGKDPRFYSNREFIYHRDPYFRNFSLSGALGADQLGMNIIGFLLVRFDDELQMAP